MLNICTSLSFRKPLFLDKYVEIDPVISVMIVVPIDANDPTISPRDCAIALNIFLAAATTIGSVNMLLRLLPMALRYPFIRAKSLNDDPNPDLKPTLKSPANRLNSSKISPNMSLKRFPCFVASGKLTVLATSPPVPNAPESLSSSEPLSFAPKLNLFMVSTLPKALCICLAAFSPFLPAPLRPLPKSAAESDASEMPFAASEAPAAVSAKPPLPVSPLYPVSISIRDAKESARGFKFAKTQLIPFTIGAKTAVRPLPKAPLRL